MNCPTLRSTPTKCWRSAVFDEGAHVRLKDKVAITTDAAQGIGFATARKFRAEGALVAVAEVEPDAAQAAVRELKRNGEAFEAPRQT